MCQKRPNVTIAKRPAAHANEEKKDKTYSELKHYIVMSNVFKGLFFISVYFGQLNRMIYYLFASLF